MSATRTLVICIALLLILGSTIAISVLFSPEVLTIEDPIESADVIVLLGGGDDGDRIFRAAELFQDGRAPLIVVSGSGDCLSNSAHLRMTGVPAAALVGECSSHTTGENAGFVSPILKRRSVRKAILVTSWFHSRRAGAVFRHVIPEVNWIVAPAQHRTDAKVRPGLAMSSLIVMEYAKIIWYGLRFGIFPF